MVVLLANQVLLIPEVEAEGLTNLLPVVAMEVPESCASGYTRKRNNNLKGERLCTTS